MASTLQTIQNDCNNQNEAQTASSMNLITAAKKREVISQETSRAKAASEALRLKKQRFKWTDERKRKFKYAVNLLGIHNAKPSKIMELMDEPGMSRTHVSSHLQKTRKEHYVKAGNGMNQNKNHLTNSSFMASKFNCFRNQAMESGSAVHPYYTPNAISNLPNAMSNLPEIKKEHRAKAENGLNQNKNHPMNPGFMASTFNCFRNQAMESGSAVRPYYIPNAMSNLPVDWKTGCMKLMLAASSAPSSFFVFLRLVSATSLLLHSMSRLR